MYSIVEINGHQYRAEAGKVIDVERLSVEVNKKVSFDQILLISNNTSGKGERTLVGTPWVKGAKIDTIVVRQGKSKKVLGARRNAGSYYKRSNHRQNYTALLVTSLSDGQGNTVKAEKKKTQKNVEVKKKESKK